jgi:hypothetical protein
MEPAVFQLAGQCLNQPSIRVTLVAGLWSEIPTSRYAAQCSSHPTTTVRYETITALTCMCDNIPKSTRLPCRRTDIQTESTGITKHIAQPHQQCSTLFVRVSPDVTLSNFLPQKWWCIIRHIHVKSQVFTAVIIKNVVYCNIKPSSYLTGDITSATEPSPLMLY